MALFQLAFHAHQASIRARLQPCRTRHLYSVILTDRERVQRGEREWKDPGNLSSTMQHQGVRLKTLFPEPCKVPGFALVRI